MTHKRDILKEVNGRMGMTVPDGYFASFADKMVSSLPEKPVAASVPDEPKRSFWKRSRPYFYMAAMFAGIWCMMKMFSMMGPSSANLSIDNYPEVISALHNDNFVNDYIYSAVDEYDVIEDLSIEGISPEEFFGMEGDSLDEAFFNEMFDEAYIQNSVPESQSVQQ